MLELGRRIALALPAVLVLLMTLGVLQLWGVAVSPAAWSFRYACPIVLVLYVAGMALGARQYDFL